MRRWPGLPRRRAATRTETMSDTHFGYTKVDERSKAERVRGVFDSVAPKWVSLMVRASCQCEWPHDDAAGPAIGASRLAPFFARRSSYCFQSSSCCEPRKNR